jgi:hypothetical protein
MARLFSLIVVMLHVAQPAVAKVALAVTTPDQNVRHREVAAGLVEALQARWDFLAPPLTADQVAPCAAELPCLHRLAVDRGADWLLAVGVAGLGTRGAIVTLQLVGPDGVSRLDDTAVLSGSADPRADGRQLAARLLAIAGPAPAPHVVERVAMSSSPPLGAALLAGGAAVVGVGAGLGAALASSVDTRDAALAVVIGSSVIGVATAAVGVVLVVVD